MSQLCSPILSILLGGAVLAALYMFARRYTTHRAQLKIIRQCRCEPPAKYPLKDPFFGIDVIYEALRAAGTKTYLGHKRSHYERHSNTFSSKLATLPVISTIEPDNIKTVLSAAFKDYIVGAPRRNAFLPVLGNSIFLADGAQWVHSRALLRPTFARSQVSDLSVLERHVEHLIEAIPRDGSTVDLGDLFLHYTADVTTDFMFGESIQSLRNPESSESSLMRAFRDAQKGVERRFRLGSFAKFVPQPTFYRAVKQVHAYVDAHIDKAIKKYALPKQSPLDDAGLEGERYVFLHELLKLTGDGQTLRDELTGIFFAGRDTTSALLSNLFFALARDPQRWQRLRDEVLDLGGRKPSLDELKSMKYLEYCLYEGEVSTLLLIPRLTLLFYSCSTSALSRSSGIVAYCDQRHGPSDRWRGGRRLPSLRSRWDSGGLPFFCSSPPGGSLGP